MAKRVSGTEEAPGSSKDLDDRHRRRLEKATRIGLVIGWSEDPRWIKLHDPTTGEWHEVRAEECLPGVVESANKYPRREAQRETRAQNEARREVRRRRPNDLEEVGDISR